MGKFPRCVGPFGKYGGGGGYSTYIPSSSHMRALALVLLALPLLSFNYRTGSSVSYSSSDTVWNHCVYFDSDNCLRQFWAVNGVTTRTSTLCPDDEKPYVTEGGFTYGGCPANGSEYEYDDRPLFYADAPTQ